VYLKLKLGTDWLLIIVVAFLIILIMYFTLVLRILDPIIWTSSINQGVFVDCSLPSNKGKGVCDRSKKFLKPLDRSKTFKLPEHAGFNLH
jgi:hypothetical protein